jgi:hypothetical protein
MIGKDLEKIEVLLFLFFGSFFAISQKVTDE